MVDIFGGMEDLKQGIVRCVGNAMERFGEDALRILRAVRFAAQLGFEIEKETREAASALAQNLQKISAERIQVELVKLLVSPYPQLLREAWEMGLTRVFFPEFDAMMETTQNHPHHCYTVGEHTLKALEFVEADKTLRLAVLLHDIAKPVTKTTEQGIDHFYGHAALGRQMSEKILRRLKFDNHTIDCVKKLVQFHDTRPETTDRSVRRLMNRAGEDLLPDLFQVMGADLLAQSPYMRVEKLLKLDRIREIYEEILLRGECVSLKTLAVTGRDLTAAGRKPGRGIGETLQRMLEDVLEEPEHNNKEYLLRTYL